jgi:predicted DNA-binding antitoxin AbrB/MazE fold protein
MARNTITVKAVFQNGVLHPAQPLPLEANQKVTVTVQWPASNVWPENVADIYAALADDDKKLAKQMWHLAKETWPTN